MFLTCSYNSQGVCLALLPLIASSPPLFPNRGPDASSPSPFAPSRKSMESSPAGRHVHERMCDAPSVNEQSLSASVETSSESDKVN